MSFITCFYAIFGPLEGTGEMNKVGRPRVPASLRPCLSLHIVCWDSCAVQCTVYGVQSTEYSVKYVMVETNNLSTIVPQVNLPLAHFSVITYMFLMTILALSIFIAIVDNAYSKVRLNWFI